MGTRSILAQNHASTNTGLGVAASGDNTRMHTHTAEYLCASGTGNATVIHYGRNGGSGSWYPICTFTFTGAANGEQATPKTLEHSWDEYKSECSVLTGTTPSVLTTMSGA